MKIVFASMVVGITGCAMPLLGVGALWALICGIVACVLARVARGKGEDNGFRKAGKICGIIATVIGAALLLLTIAMVVFGLNMVSQYAGEIEDVARAGQDAIGSLGGGW